MSYDLYSQERTEYGADYLDNSKVLTFRYVERFGYYAYYNNSNSVGIWIMKSKFTLDSAMFVGCKCFGGLYERLSASEKAEIEAEIPILLQACQGYYVC